MREKTCENCGEIACGADCYDQSHWTPRLEPKKEDCPECGAPYPLPHAPYCKVGEAF